VRRLRHGSDIIEQLIQKAGLMVVGAEYSLDTGVVDFFDGLPGRRQLLLPPATIILAGLKPSSSVHHRAV